MSNEREKLVERAQQILASCLSEWGHPQEAENVLASVDLESYDTELRLISQLLNFGFEDHAHRAAPSPPADAGWGGLVDALLTDLRAAATLQRPLTHGEVDDIGRRINAALTAKAAAPAPVDGVDLHWLASSIGEVAHRLASYMPHLSEWADRANSCRMAAAVLRDIASRDAAPAPGVGEAVALPREILTALYERDGGKACGCINRSRKAELEYESGQCPHQRLAQYLAAPPAPQEDAEALALLAWMQEREYDLCTCRESIDGDEYQILWFIVDGKKSSRTQWHTVSGHPLASPIDALRAARDRAIAAQAGEVGNG